VASIGGESHISFGVDVDLPVRLDPTLETVLYRVAQEALTNVVKHSRAEHAEIAMRVRDRMVALDVRDDGIGFDPDSVDALGR